MVGTILQMLGHDLSEKMLNEIIEEVDADGKFASERFSLSTKLSKPSFLIIRSYC